MIMPAQAQQALRVAIRDATLADIPDIMRLKVELATSDNIGYTVRATAVDWARDGFGPAAHFTIFVAEIPRRTGATPHRVVGIAICAERYYPGWVGPTVALLDICVEARFRGQGVGTALLQKVAQFGKARDSIMIELTMRAGNRAGRLYERMGFAPVSEACTYVIAGGALDRLAAPTAAG